MLTVFLRALLAGTLGLSTAEVDVFDILVEEEVFCAIGSFFASVLDDLCWGVALEVVPPDMVAVGPRCWGKSSVKSRRDVWIREK